MGFTPATEKMSETPIVIVYVAVPESAMSLSGNGGTGFLRLLSEKGIVNALYVGPGVKPASYKEAATKTIEQAAALVGQALLKHKTVFFVSDSPEAASMAAREDGCLPFLISNKNAGFGETDYIEVDGLSALSAYFDGPPPRHLMSMLRVRPDVYKAELNARSELIAEQIKRRGGVHIFGTGANGRTVHGECTKAGIGVLGFVDNDPQRQGSQLLALPVRGPSGLSPSKDVVVVANGNCPYDMQKQLQESGFKYIQNLAEFFFAHNCFSQLGIFFHDDLWRSGARYHELYLRLADAESRKVLDNMVGFHKGFDLSLAAEICDRQNPQWFDKRFFKPGTEQVFVDGGAFDGDTALRFIELSRGAYKAVHLFEADPDIAKRAADNLKKYEGVFVHNMGLSDKAGTLFFEQTGLTDGRLGGEGGVAVRVDTVDNIVKDKVTFLKVDVEGAEKEALAGAGRHISEDSPLLAVAVYHRAEDIWALPGRILRMNSGYNLYLRHYTQFAYETVLYAVPGQ